MVHLLANPLNNGTPEMDRDAISAVAAVSGMYLHNPPSLFRFCVPVAWSIEPALRKSSDLKTPWFKVWKSAPVIASTASVAAPVPAGGSKAMHAPKPSMM